MLSSIPANLIRQWCYCSRVVYYMELIRTPVFRPAWIQQGTDFHQIEEKLWQRRDLSRFKLDSGKKYYNLKLQSTNLGLHGIVDMAIETDNAVYAVEFKLSANNKKRGDILQLVAYAMLLEEYFSKPSPIGFLTGKGKILHTVNMNSDKRQSVIEIAQKIRKMLHRGLKPESSATAFQCCNCEYINFCNDRL